MFSFRALAAEQGNPVPEQPIVFMKPTSSYVTEGQSIQVSSLHCSFIKHRKIRFSPPVKNVKKILNLEIFFYWTLYNISINQPHAVRHSTIWKHVEHFIRNRDVVEMGSFLIYEVYVWDPDFIDGQMMKLQYG